MSLCEASLHYQLAWVCDCPTARCSTQVYRAQSLVHVLSPVPGGNRASGKLGLRAAAPKVEWATSNPQHLAPYPHIRQAELPFRWSFPKVHTSSSPPVCSFRGNLVGTDIRGAAILLCPSPARTTPRVWRREVPRTTPHALRVAADRSGVPGETPPKGQHELHQCLALR